MALRSLALLFLVIQVASAFRIRKGDAGMCRKVAVAFKKACGSKGLSDCSRCVRKGYGKLQRECGEQAGRVAAGICINAANDDGDDDQGDDWLTCASTIKAFKKTCGKKGDGCDTCVRESFLKLEEACGEKASHASPWICKRRVRDSDEEGDDDEEALAQVKSGESFCRDIKSCAKNPVLMAKTSEEKRYPEYGDFVEETMLLLNAGGEAILLNNGYGESDGGDPVCFGGKVQFSGSWSKAGQTTYAVELTRQTNLPCSYFYRPYQPMGRALSPPATLEVAVTGSQVELLTALNLEYTKLTLQ